MVELSKCCEGLEPNRFKQTLPFCQTMFNKKNGEKCEGNGLRSLLFVSLGDGKRVVVHNRQNPYFTPKTVVLRHHKQPHARASSGIVNTQNAICAGNVTSETAMATLSADQTRALSTSTHQRITRYDLSLSPTLRVRSTSPCNHELRSRRNPWLTAMQ